MPDIQADLAYAVEDFSNTLRTCMALEHPLHRHRRRSVYAGLYAIIQPL